MQSMGGVTGKSKKKKRKKRKKKQKPLAQIGESEAGIQIQQAPEITIESLIDDIQAKKPALLFRNTAKAWMEDINKHCDDEESKIE